MILVTASDTDRPAGDGPRHAAGPTAALLWAACRPEPDDAAAEQALRRGADLQWASRVAVAQRVSALLWRVAQRWSTDADGWSPAVREDVSRCKAQTLLLRPRVKSHLLDPLAAAGILPLVIKGLALCDRYPDPALRPMDDVDLVVPPETHREAVAALRQSGWRVAPQQLAPFSTTLTHPEMPGLPVDLHHALAARSEEIFRLNASDLWNARRPVTPLGANSFGLSSEMDLLVVATHAGKLYHNFDRLIWAVDAAVVIQAGGEGGTPIDWHRLEELADRAGARSALAVLLAQAMRLGAASPARLRHIGAGPARRRVLDRPRSATWPLEQVVHPERRRLTYAVIDDPRLRVRRFLYEIAEGGIVRAPARAISLACRILLRTWRLREASPDPGSDLSTEQWDEQVDPVLGDREL